MEPKKTPRESLATILGMVAAIEGGLTAPEQLAIPPGMICTACHRPVEHARDCRPPRGLAPRPA